MACRRNWIMSERWIWVKNNGFIIQTIFARTLHVMRPFFIINNDNGVFSSRVHYKVDKGNLYWVHIHTGNSISRLAVLFSLLIITKFASATPTEYIGFLHFYRLLWLENVTSYSSIKHNKLAESVLNRSVSFFFTFQLAHSPKVLYIHNQN